MAKRDQLSEQIEAYLAGEMTPEEKTSFETQIRTDEVLAAELRLHQGTHKLLNLYTQIDYKEKLQRLDVEGDLKEKTKVVPFATRLFRHPVFRAAAVILVLVACAWTLLIFQYDPERVGTAQFEPYRDVITYKGDTSPSDSLILAAMAQYNRKEYAAARETLEKTLGQYPDLADARFYLAMCLLAQNEPAEATAHLQQLTHNDKYGEVSEWYLVLAWLKAGNRRQSLEVLDTILSNPGHGYREKAENLHQKLTGWGWRIPGVG
ncbi:MAG: tetratricopeptide repeat protein [Bacteroidia bacterium]|nr:tetratricopeptide repeat protein [Bacteroidia bacterium]